MILKIDITQIFNKLVLKKKTVKIEHTSEWFFTLISFYFLCLCITCHFC